MSSSYQESWWKDWFYEKARVKKAPLFFQRASWKISYLRRLWWLEIPESQRFLGQGQFSEFVDQTFVNNMPLYFQENFWKDYFCDKAFANKHFLVYPEEDCWEKQFSEASQC